MNRRLVFYALLIAMLLQAVSLGGHWAGRSHSAQTLHDVMHWAGIAHHHHAELQADELVATTSPPASYHQDRSADSNRHMSMDACLQLLGPIPAGVSSPTLPVTCSHVVPSAETAPDGPVLEGPRRPPKFLA